MARRQRRAKADINVVPYIDVMLVLLVIFMVAAPMMQPGVVNLPTVSQADRRQDQKPLKVLVDKDGFMELSGVGPQPLPVAGVGDLIDKIKAASQQEARPVLISGDAEVRYQTIVKVMDALKKGGVERVGLEVKPES